MMISAHQKQNTTGGANYNVCTYRNCAFPPHFHKSFELAHLTRGSASFTVRDKTYPLQTGDFVMVLPFEAHAFSVGADGQLTVTVFSADLAGAFAQAVSGMQGETPVFRCSEAVCRFCADASEPDTYAGIPDTADLLRVQARLYAVCAEYLSAVRLRPRDRTTDALPRLLGYLEENFREDISVSRAARAIGYSERSLSAILRDTLQLSFRALLNQYRFEYASRMLRSGACSITDVALESGFQSVRTFNRVFRALGGQSPRQALRTGPAPAALQPQQAGASAGASHPAEPPA